MFGRATLDGVEPRHAVLELLVPQDLSHSVANLSTVVSSRTADLLLLDANPLQDIQRRRREQEHGCAFAGWERHVRQRDRDVRIAGRER